MGILMGFHHCQIFQPDVIDWRSGDLRPFMPGRCCGSLMFFIFLEIRATTGEVKTHSPLWGGIFVGNWNLWSADRWAEKTLLRVLSCTLICSFEVWPISRVQCSDWPDWRECHRWGNAWITGTPGVKASTQTFKKKKLERLMWKNTSRSLPSERERDT